MKITHPHKQPCHHNLQLSRGGKPIGGGGNYNTQSLVSKETNTHLPVHHFGGAVTVDPLPCLLQPATSSAAAIAVRQKCPHDGRLVDRHYSNTPAQKTSKTRTLPYCLGVFGWCFSCSRVSHQMSPPSSLKMMGAAAPVTRPQVVNAVNIYHWLVPHFGVKLAAGWTTIVPSFFVLPLLLCSYNAVLHM